ncbi:MAG: hypothetical protein GY772_17640, partial [bacterium]|nr:hypothetical protein [bacterium]
VEKLGEDEELLADCHIDVQAAYLGWSLEVNEAEVQYVPLALSMQVLEVELDFAMSGLKVDKDMEQHMKRVTLLRRKKNEAKLLLVPIYHPSREGASRHFTLLALRRNEGEVAVEYFDSLPRVHAGSLRLAKAMLQLLGVPREDLNRCNRMRQFGSTCGFFVLHYIEDFMRWQQGQGRATQGWCHTVRIQAMRSQMIRLLTKLEAERVKWANEVLREKEMEEARHL